MTRSAALADLRASIAKGIIALRPLRCLCGASDDVTLADEDHNSIPVQTLLCRCCGTVRSGHAVSDQDAELYYRAHYRHIYTGAGDAAERRVKQYAYAQRLIEDQGDAYLCCDVVVEMGADQGGGGDYFNEGAYYPVEVGECIPTSSATLLYSVHTLEHQPRPVEALRGWAKHVKEGGTIITVVPDLLFEGRRDPVATWWCLPHPWNWTIDTVAIPHVLAGLTVEDVYVAPPGRFASVGSLVVTCTKDNRAKKVLDYVEGHR